MLLPEGILAGGVATAPIIISSGNVDEVMYVSQARLLDSLLALTQQKCPSQTIVMSPDGCIDGEEMSTRRGNKKHTVKTAASSMPKKKKCSPSTITRRWQSVWAYKYTWDEGDFDANGDLEGVICQCCSLISRRRKVIMVKGDNLEKHKGKRVCLEDGVPFPHLKKGETFTKVNCKHLLNSKLWAGWQQCGSMADQLLACFDGELR